MWMYNSDHSDSDNFGAESETSSLVTAICHSCLDIVQVRLSALKNIVNKLPSPICQGEFFSYGLSNIFLVLNDTIRIAIRIVYRINVSTIRIVSSI